MTLSMLMAQASRDSHLYRLYYRLEGLVAGEQSSVPCDAQALLANATEPMDAPLALEIRRLLGIE